MILIIILVVVLFIVIWCISTVNGFKKKEIRVQEGLSGEVRISDNAKKLRKQHKNDSVEMENEVFNKRFLVTTGNAPGCVLCPRSPHDGVYPRYGGQERR